MWDEPAVAHEARCKLVMGHRSRDEHTNQIRRQLNISDRAWSELPRLHRLALNAQVAPTEYARMHSMLPIHRVAARANQIAAHGSDAAASFSRHLGLVNQKLGGYVCRQCIEQDLATHSFSWFRRSHHLTGVHWCCEHGVALERVDDPNPFDLTPHLWLDQGKTIPSEAHHSTMPTDGFVRNYIDIALGLLSRPRPVACTVLNSLLSARARRLGLRISENGRVPLVSDKLMDATDATWLMAVACMEDKSRGRFHNRIDIITKSPSVPGVGESYALILAVLFGAAKVALEVVSEADAVSHCEVKNVD